MILYTRVINLVLSVCMILTSLLSLLTTTDATTGVLACYVVVFSCLLCCFETHLKQISKIIAANFGFMYSAKSRCLFMIFVGTILFSFSLFGKVIGLAMLANAGFNFYAIVMYPGYEDAQRKDAQSEIQDFLSANPAYAKTALSMGMSAGAELVSNNPGYLFLIFCCFVLFLSFYLCSSRSLLSSIPLPLSAFSCLSLFALSTSFRACTSKCTNIFCRPPS
jgi:hypothetical protein